MLRNEDRRPEHQPGPDRPRGHPRCRGRTAASRRAAWEAVRQLRAAARQSGEALRELRLQAGLTQAAVARAIGVHRSVICRLEAGDPAVSLRVRARAAAVLGGELRLSVYPAAAPLIDDAAQARIVELLLAERHPSWRATVEAPVPGGGRRSVDLLLERPGEGVLHEVETRVRRWEELLRELREKAAAFSAADSGRRVRLVLVLPASAHHRALARAHPETIRAAFPVPSDELERALRDATGPWPGDGILWVSPAPRPRLLTTPRGARR